MIIFKKRAENVHSKIIIQINIYESNYQIYYN